MNEIIELLEKAKGEVNDTLFVSDHSKHKIGELVVSAKKHIDQVIFLLRERLEVEPLRSLERGKIYALQLTSLDGIDDFIDNLAHMKETFEIEFVVFGPEMSLVSMPEGLEVKEKKHE